LGLGHLGIADDAGFVDVFRGWDGRSPATNITPANATANIALANWLPSSILPHRNH